MRPRPVSMTHWASSAPGCDWSAYASRAWCPAPRCNDSWCWGSANTAGPTQTGRWIVPAEGSDPEPYDRPACSPEDQSDQFVNNSGPEVPPLRSEEHTSELQSLMRISSAVFCLKKKNKTIEKHQ